MSLYPLLFETIYKDKIWGGNKINTILGKDYGDLPNCGETWEISGVSGNVSVVKNGKLAGKTLTQLIGENPVELLGKKVYEQFGTDFPLLVKFIDANDDLSIQVHPDDKLAKERHNSFGKTEMWYIFQADKGATLNSGFKKTIDKETYLKHLNSNTLDEILNFENVQDGDVYFLPAGRVHYIGKGIMLAEIQQTSDITYRIYDFDRKDDTGNLRELHTELAVDAIDYNGYPDYKTKYVSQKDKNVPLVSCQYFTTNLLDISKSYEADYSALDSFVIYVCFQGEAVIKTAQSETKIKMGDCVLIPASIDSVEIIPSKETKLLESFIA